MTGTNTLLWIHISLSEMQQFIHILYMVAHSLLHNVMFAIVRVQYFQMSVLMLKTGNEK